MARRTTLTTQEYLIQASLPAATDSYTVISHQAVIDKTKEVLASKGYIIKRELYRCNQGAQVAQGIYHLEHGNDPDMSMLFAWGNSYDKSMKFKCSIGAYVHTSLASIIGSNMEIFNRKHTGTADNECFETITSQINNADAYFQQLIADKEAMKLIPLTNDRRAELTGRIYLINELLTSKQLAIVKGEYNKPSFDYTGIEGSLWSMYNAIIYSLQKAHPKTWMDQQRMVHYVLCEEFNIKTGVFVHLLPEKENNQPEINIDPQQIDLETMIAEVEAEKVLNNIIKDNPEIVENMDKAFTEEVVFGKSMVHINHTKTPEEFLESEPIVVEKSETGESLETVSFEVPEVSYFDMTSPDSQEISKDIIGTNTGLPIATILENLKPEPLKVITNVNTGQDLNVNRLPKEEVIPEPILEEDHSWSCLKCGEVQGIADPFHEGQLCTLCF